MSESPVHEVSPAELRHLERRYSGVFLGVDLANKLSGGFYDHHFIPEFPGGYFRHDYFAVTYLLEGGGVFGVGDGPRCRYGPGSLLIRHADQPLFCSKHYTAEGRWLEFSAALPQPLYRMMLDTGILELGMNHLEAGVSHHLLAAAGHYIDSLDFVNRHGGRCLAFSAFFELFGALKQAAHHRQRPAETDDDLLIEKAQELLSFDVAREINMPEFARRLGIGYERFRKKFQRRTGLPPNEYHILRRLDKADALLLHTRLSVKEIAGKLGYSSASSFTRQYARFRHHPPSKLRGGE